MNQGEEYLRKSPLRESLELKETDELLDIWKRNDREEWSIDAFKVIREILLERLDEVPQQGDFERTPEEIIDLAQEHLDRASDLYDADKLDLALQECDQAMEIAPDHAENYNLRGMILYDQDRILDAISDFREAIRLDHEHQGARDNMRVAQEEYAASLEGSAAKQHLDRAVDFAENDQLEMALEECGAAIELSPEYPQAYNYQGMVFQALGRSEEAVTSYRKAIELDPTFSNAYENLAAADQLSLRTKFENIVGLNIEEDQEYIDEGELEDLAIEELEEAADGTWEVGNTAEDNAPVPLGWPGRRTLPGRSGLDPIDTYNEEAHIEGTIFRKLITGRFRTDNPVYLVGMTVLGLILVLPVALYLLGSISGNNIIYGIIIFILVSPIWGLGGLLLFNVLRSLTTIRDIDEEEDGSPFF